MIEFAAEALRDYEQRHRRHTADIVVDDVHRHKVEAMIEGLNAAGFVIVPRAAPVHELLVDVTVMVESRMSLRPKPANQKPPQASASSVMNGERVIANALSEALAEAQGQMELGAKESSEIEVTPEMIAAGVDAMTCEFDGPSENPGTDYEVAAERVFRAMLARRIPYRTALPSER